MAECKSCGATIEWIKLDETRRWISLDPGVFEKGNIAVVNGRAHYYSAEDARLHRERRQTHFASCPDADRWRNGGEAG